MDLTPLKVELSATPCADFPAEQAITPCFFSASVKFKYFIAGPAHFKTAGALIIF